MTDSTQPAPVPVPTTGNASPFDTIRRIREDGSEYWSARDLQPLLGYSKWQDFKNAVERAKIAVGAQGNGVDVHFMGVHKVSTSGPAQRDVELTRFAAYQVAMCGDPRKPEVAAALAYFAIRTREAETRPALSQLDILRAAIDQIEQAQLTADRADAKAQKALDRIEAIAPPGREDLYYSATAWARLNGVDMPLYYARKLGAKAGILGRAAGLTPDQIPDGRFAVVNGWPLWVWDAAHDAIENAVIA